MPERDQATARLPADLLILLAAVAVVGCNSLVLSPILADIAASLQAAPVAVSRAGAAFGGGTAVSALVLGHHIDRVGARRALRLGIALVGVAMLASAAATHWLMLAGSQAVAGIGAGLVLPSAYGLAAAVAPPRQEARALGRVLLGWSVSLVGGVPLSAFTTELIGWRVVFVILAAMAGVTFVGARRLPGSRPVAGVSGGHPLSPLSMPGVPTLLLACLAYMASFYGVYAFLAEHIRAVHQISAGRTGLLVLAYGIGFGVAGWGDTVLDRVGPHRIFAPTLVVLAVVYLIMPLAAWNLVAISALCVVWGFANHFGLTVLLQLLTSGRDATRGAVLGLNSAVTYFGAMAGVGVGGPLYETLGFASVAEVAGATMAAAAVVFATRRSG